MSELTEWLEIKCQCETCRAGEPCRARKALLFVAEHLPAHDAAIREQAKREQMISDVQFADAAEPDGWAPCAPFDWLGVWCEARQAAVRAIRAAYAKAHPEDHD